MSLPLKASEELRRERAMIEVPGLSPKAEAALRAFAKAAIRPGWTPPQLSKDRNPDPEWIVAMAKSARLYEAILADGPLLAELNRFEKATGSRSAPGGQIGPAKSGEMPNEERLAAHLLGVLVAARALHAWYPILQQHLETNIVLKLRVEQAEFMLRLNADRLRQGPRRESLPGPSVGPGI